MEVIRLAVILVVAVGCVLIATRPAPHRRRGDRARLRERSQRSTDPLSRSPRTVGSFRLTVRNHWDRSDLARVVGRDESDPGAPAGIWPELAASR
jgi:hypothetical protein